jgi:DNA-binding XRE family transcriptional regulator
MGCSPWKKLVDKLPPEQRQRAKVKSEQLRLGLLLADLRRQSGLTQSEVADRLGISQPGISQIESEGEMQVGTLKRLVEVYGGEVILRMPIGEVPLAPGS